jgi:hypothetical protein
MKLRFFPAVCLLVSIAPLVAQGVAAPVERMEASTVRIISKLRDGYATGSGFIIGNRYVVTNHHVIADADEVGVLAKNLKLSVSRIVIDSTDKDLAVLEVESDTGRPAVTLALNSGVQKTETVLAAGFPAAADDQGDNVNNLLEVKFSQGIISGFVTGQNGEALYQISAPLNPGNSGGPLFDECGRVIGINVEKSLVQAVVVGQDGSTSTERVPLGEGIAWSIQSDELVNLLRGSDIQVQVASNVCTPGAASTSGAGLENSGASAIPSGANTTSTGQGGPFWGSPLSYILLGLLVFGLIAFGVVAIVVRSQTSSSAPAPPGPYISPPTPFPAPPQLPYAGSQRRLRGLSGTFRNTNFPLTPAPITMGRSPRQSQIVFKESDQVISKRHCTVRLDQSASGVLLEDCNSLNGTFLESGERLRGGEPRLLRAGNRFYLGSRDNMFEVE